MAGATLSGCLPPRALLRGAPWPPPLEARVWQEVNLARTHPEIYARYLESWLPLLDGNRLQRAGWRAWALTEGRPAIEEAVRYLRAQPPRLPLALSPGMSEGARDLIVDLGPAAVKGHVGLDGSGVGERLARHGAWARRAAELIQYGATEPREIVALLIVDDGVPDRGHRRLLFDPDYRVMGVAVGPHGRFRSMCVITLAAGYSERWRGAWTRLRRVY